MISIGGQRRGWRLGRIGSSREMAFEKRVIAVKHRRYPHSLPLPNWGRKNASPIPSRGITFPGSLTTLDGVTLSTVVEGAGAGR
jgi:hypothetical protein